MNIIMDCVPGPKSGHFTCIEVVNVVEKWPLVKVQLCMYILLPELIKLQINFYVERTDL